jgi:protein translocase SecG subunit
MENGQWKMILQIIQIIVALLLVISILLQAQGGGISPVFGGGGEMYRSKRNVEKLLIYATILFATILGGISIFLLVIPQK